MKKSFLLYDDQLEILDHLTDEQAGQIFKAIRAYHKALKTEKNQSVNLGLDGLMLALFNQFKSQLDREFEAYKAKCERNKANGKKGGRPKTNETEDNPNNPDGLNQNPENHDNDTDKDNDTDTKKIDSKGSRLDTLSMENKKELYIYMKTYCTDNEIDEIEIEKFKDHWIAKSGKDAVKKDWKATFRNWCRNDWVKKKDVIPTVQHPQSKKEKSDEFIDKYFSQSEEPVEVEVLNDSQRNS